MSIWSCIPLWLFVVLGPLARVSEVRCEGALCWGSVLQDFLCLVKVIFWVAWVHVGCPQVIQVVEHRVIIDVTIGVFAFETAYQVTVNKIEAQEGAAVFTHLVDGEGAPIGGGRSRRRDCISSHRD
jgi:hypothetical protein